MTVMYSFCFWYSVRLGSIIVAFTCMAQCLAALIACGYGLNDLEKTSWNIDFWLRTSDLQMAEFVFEALRDDTKTFLTAFIAVLSLYFCSCILLIYAAFHCNTTFMYPFMILDFARLIFLSFALVIVLMIIKGNTLNLGIIIGCSIFGAFSLLYLWYQWFCVLSLWQIIREIESLDQELSRTKPIISSTQENMIKLDSNYNPPIYLPHVSN